MKSSSVHWWRKTSVAPCSSEGSTIFRRGSSFWRYGIYRRYGVFRRCGFSRRYGIAAIPMLCWIAGGIHAEELPVLEFSIKPRLCILTESEEACYDELQVRWRAPQRLSLCLFQNELEDPITCWHQVTEGQHRFVLSASDNVTFHLREPGKGRQVTEAFEVIHDHRQYRRQRRNPWSFF